MRAESRKKEPAPVVPAQRGRINESTADGLSYSEGARKTIGESHKNEGETKRSLTSFYSYFSIKSASADSLHCVLSILYHWFSINVN
jgi:hypothetical protein